MRFLKFENGNLCLTKYLTNDIPPYAILSHTWGDEEQEVSFQDVTESTGRNKSGYRKIRFCGKQAAVDGLQHFWVDTCCINKPNHTELSEAINSMFRWYQNATKCYVYLSDVSKNPITKDDEPLRSAWKSEFRKSKWFTRGWTLQELLAPSSVEFFALDGQRLGDKKSLELLLSEITGVAIDALRGSPLSDFTIEKRMSWSEGRETSRPEDKIYSLLGIFGISMLPNYGETEANARRRLKVKIEHDWAVSKKVFTYLKHLLTTYYL